ncbi:MAG: L,D-transpeptidase family protein [Chromatiales bacterium]|nr:MAG: L,D-transpeptidase family protein [Chromatiales bacterium]
MTRLMTFAVLTAWFAAASPATADEVGELLQDRIDELLYTGELSVAGQAIVSGQLLADIYAQNEFRPLWSAERTGELIEMIAIGAPAEGLLARDYHYETLQQLLAEQQANPDPLTRANLDLVGTDAIIRIGYHQRFGKVDPSDLDPNVNFRRELWPDRDPASAVIGAATSTDPLLDIVQGFFPRSYYYVGLRDQLLRHLQIQADGGWPAVTPGATLRPGDVDPRVVEMRRRLAVTGDLPAGADLESDTYDASLEAAVKVFQGRHGLDADGISGAKTFEALNVPVQTRINQLRMSLERLRWIDQDVTNDFVAVNIPDYRVFLLRDRKIVWSARAQVGKPYRATPIFRGDIQYLELNPTWTVPPGILRNDILPRLKQDPSYVVNKNISVIDRDGRTVDPFSVDWSKYSRGVPYTLRQEPGPNNALGRIKFIFPNEHFVFLHDTPSRSLFDRSERAFSSGCIRIDKPLELAELLLRDPDNWSQADLQAVLDSRETRRVNLKPREPVLILYLTASLDLDGSIRFAKDIYDRDAGLLAALNGPVRLTPPAGVAAAE